MAEREVVVVTGAARGIGAAVLQAFAAHDKTVVALDADEHTLRETAGKLQADGHDVHAQRLDVTDAGAVEVAVAAVEREHGPIATLVNGAGVLKTGPVIEMPDSDWANLFAVNSTGVFLMSRAVARRMIPRRAGSIVTISSNAGGVPRVSMAGYAASKAAATMFTKSFGLELARHGIRCNVVAPGSTDTPMLRALGATEAELIAGSPEAYKTGIPLGRIARPADIAGAVVFLASPAAGHITMQELYVDGGAALGG